ncbi:hypothetical protein PHYC_02344 [Phycisphaerales bacterium]|nr:hypothetical protein PHYC_02344 [Phycisphaerales bacterium]
MFQPGFPLFSSPGGRTTFARDGASTSLAAGPHSSASGGRAIEFGDEREIE